MPDDWIDKLVEDPASPPRLQVLTGYRGRSAQESHTRLYSDPELTSWVDVPNDAVLLTREVQDELGLGRTLVWTRIDAQIQMGPQAPGTGAEWFQGPLAQDFGAAGAPLRTPRFECPLPSPPRLCPTENLRFTPCCPQTPGCPTNPQLPPCVPPQTPNCPSPLRRCPTDFGPRCTPLCPTEGRPRCQPGGSTQQIFCPVTPEVACNPPSQFFPCPQALGGGPWGGGFGDLGAQAVGPTPPFQTPNCPTPACPSNPLRCFPTPRCPSWLIMCTQLCPSQWTCVPTILCPLDPNKRS